MGIRDRYGNRLVASVNLIVALGGGWNGLPTPQAANTAAAPATGGTPDAAPANEPAVAPTPASTR